MSLDSLRKDYDPVTLEVIRMRLDNIVEEMGIAMIRSSGSPVITEARDYNTALFDAQGRIYSYSDAVQLHIGSGGVAVRNLIATVGPGEIEPGDAFISNDPHTSGSSHPPDTSVISPIFRGEELVGFAQSQAHLVDVGGMAAGGFAPDATDCYGEALRLPPGVKIFERGRPVESVRRLIANNVRTPVLHWNDVRSMVASNNTGIRRLLDSIDEFGVETFADYTALSFELAEQVLRQRIQQIPDGTFTAEEWVEGNGHSDRLFRVFCTMTVDGDAITLDFTGSSPQTDGFVNCSLGALIGSIATAIVPILGWDVPFNEGVMTAFTIIAPSGSIVNPTPPAPISNGHLTTGARATRLVTRLLNGACVASDNPMIRQRVQGEWADGWVGGITSGVRGGDGDFYVWFNMDGGGIGAGAQTVRDGHDAAGLLTQVGNMLPDVEMNEMLYPALYLWKKLATDSCGHGASRGGMGLDFAWTLWGADESTETLFAPTAAVPPWGFAGGTPAGGGGHEFLRGTNVKQLLAQGRYPLRADITAADIELQEVGAQGLPLGRDDVFHQWSGGGGGIGDPLLRDPRQVVADVLDGFITAAQAETVYGVAIAGDAADSAGTTALRNRIRADRLTAAGAAAPTESDLTPTAVELIDRRLVPARTAGGWECPVCDGDLGSDPSWTGRAVRSTFSAFDRLADIGVRVRERVADERVLLDEHLCPHCGTQLHSQVRVETGG